MEGIHKRNTRLLLSTTACLSLLAGIRGAQAHDFLLDNGVDIRFDNTIQYSVTERTAPESSVFANSINANDGDNNLRAGIVSNRIDLLSKFDISYSGFGFDASVDSFYDTVYNQKTQNRDNATYNAATEPASKFTSATRTQAGRNVELRNLFVYGGETIDGVPVTLRVGRLVNLFGESLFFAQNGIAYGMAPLDIARAISVPGTQAKDLFLPSGQALISAQLTDSISMSAYYQFEWQKFNFIPSGSYFSTADLLDAGGQRIIAVPEGGLSPFLPTTAAYLYRGPDQSGADTGQFGAALHYDPANSAWDFGLYALQYNDSEPQVYTHLNAIDPVTHQPIGIPVPGTAPGAPSAFSVGTYQLVYADHIQTYGASASTTIGALNLAGEVSARTHEDLNSSVTLQYGQTANNSNNSLYATGNTLHYQMSGIYLGPKEPGLWDGSSLVGEVAGVNLLGFDKNKQNFDRAASAHMAIGLRFVATANYFQVLPGLDINPKIGLGWNFMGKAPDTLAFNTTGIDRGGDLTLGADAVFLNKWTGGISYTYYISPPGRDAYADRDFVAFNVERTF